LQYELYQKPDSGAVIPGAAPLRKIRWSDERRGKGKRGGLRIIYLHVPEFEVVFLMDMYGKDEVDDLPANEKKELRQLAKIFVESLKERYRRGSL